MNMNLQVNLQVDTKIKIVTNESYSFTTTEEVETIYTIIKNDRYNNYDLVDKNSVSFAGRFYSINDIIPLLNELLVSDSKWFLSYEILNNNNNNNNLSKIPFPNKDVILFLKLIKSDYKWITKDKDELVGIYKKKPYKKDEWWTNNEDYINITSTFNLDFDFLSWDNPEPTLISDILLNIEEE